MEEYKNELWQGTVLRDTYILKERIGRGGLPSWVFGF